MRVACTNIVLLWGAFVSGVPAIEVVKCTGPDGNVTFTDGLCDSDATPSSVDVTPPDRDGSPDRGELDQLREDYFKQREEDRATARADQAEKSQRLRDKCRSLEIEWKAALRDARSFEIPGAAEESIAEETRRKYEEQKQRDSFRERAGELQRRVERCEKYLD